MLGLRGWRKKSKSNIVNNLSDHLVDQDLLKVEEILLSIINKFLTYKKEGKFPVYAREFFTNIVDKLTIHYRLIDKAIEFDDDTARLFSVIFNLKTAEKVIESTIFHYVAHYSNDKLLDSLKLQVLNLLFKADSDKAINSIYTVKNHERKTAHEIADKENNKGFLNALYIASQKNQSVDNKEEYNVLCILFDKIAQKPLQDSIDLLHRVMPLFTGAQTKNNIFHMLALEKQLTDDQTYILRLCLDIDRDGVIYTICNCENNNEETAYEIAEKSNNLEFFKIIDLKENEVFSHLSSFSSDGIGKSSDSGFIDASNDESSAENSSRKSSVSLLTDPEIDTNNNELNASQHYSTENNISKVSREVSTSSLSTVDLNSDDEQSKSQHPQNRKFYIALAVGFLAMSVCCFVLSGVYVSSLLFAIGAASTMTTVAIICCSKYSPSSMLTSTKVTTINNEQGIKI